MDERHFRLKTSAIQLPCKVKIKLFERDTNAENQSVQCVKTFFYVIFKKDTFF